MNEDKKQAGEDKQANDASDALTGGDVLTAEASTRPEKNSNEPAKDTSNRPDQSDDDKTTEAIQLEDKTEKAEEKAENTLLENQNNESRIDAPKEEVQDAPEHIKTSHKLKTEAPPIKNKKNKSTRFLILFFIVILMLVLAGAGFGSYKVYEYFNQQNAELVEQFKALKDQYGNVTTRIDSAQKKNDTHAATHQAFSKQLDAFNQKIQTAEQRLASQRKRILSMSTTSREDWLLAEAEYLIKLANQRILVERNAQGAATLLVEADAILKDLGDPDLFAIRRQLANDISSVRLIEKVDVEGVFLQMQALIHAVESLPINPTWNQKKTSASSIINGAQSQSIEKESDNKQNAQAQQAKEQSDVSILNKTKKGFYGFLRTFDNYVRIRKYDAQEEKALLIATPEQSHYYKQILQLMIEKASVALLREQPIIFKGSLEQAQVWLDKKFPVSSQQSTLIAELETIKKINIEQKLPDITQSLEALKEYILTLHSLKGTAAQGGAK